MFLDAVAQMRVGVNHVVIAPAFLDPLDDAGLLQFADQAKRRSFSDADLLGNVSQARVRVLGQAHQHVRVITEESPLMNGVCHG